MPRPSGAQSALPTSFCSGRRPPPASDTRASVPLNWNHHECRKPSDTAISPLADIASRLAGGSPRPRDSALPIREVNTS